MKVKVYGWDSKPIDVEEMNVHFMDEAMVWFEFITKNGRKISTYVFKGGV